MSGGLGEREIDFLMRLRSGSRLRHADRVEDRVRQRVKKMGFALVVMNPRRWTITPDGIDALSRIGK